MESDVVNSWAILVLLTKAHPNMGGNDCCKPEPWSPARPTAASCTGEYLSQAPPRYNDKPPYLHALSSFWLPLNFAGRDCLPCVLLNTSFCQHVCDASAAVFGRHYHCCTALLVPLDNCHTIYPVFACWAFYYSKHLVSCHWGDRSPDLLCSSALVSDFFPQFWDSCLILGAYSKQLTRKSPFRLFPQPLWLPWSTLTVVIFDVLGYLLEYTH